VADLADDSLDVADVLRLDLSGIRLGIDADASRLMVVCSERPRHRAFRERLFAAASRGQLQRPVGRLFLRFASRSRRHPAAVGHVWAWFGGLGSLLVH